MPALPLPCSVVPHLSCPTLSDPLRCRPDLVASQKPFTSPPPPTRARPSQSPVSVRPTLPRRRTASASASATTDRNRTAPQPRRAALHLAPTRLFAPLLAIPSRERNTRPAQTTAHLAAGHYTAVHCRVRSCASSHLTFDFLPYPLLLFLLILLVLFHALAGSVLIAASAPARRSSHTSSVRPYRVLDVSDRNDLAQVTDRVSMATEWPVRAPADLLVDCLGLCHSP